MDTRFARSDKNRKKEFEMRRSQSPNECSPKVRILKSSNNASVRVSSPQPIDASNISVLSPTSAVSNASVTTVVHSSQQQQTSQPSNDELIEEMIENTPKVMKLLDVENWSFLEHPVVDYLFGENVSSSFGGFKVISAVGTQSVGKSSVLNQIAGSNVFKVHTDNGESDLLLKHCTHGIDLHITRERLFLLDSQPLLSASILDDYIKSGITPCTLNSDSSEPETYVYITSLQLVSCLLAICDYMIVVSDWALDFHLIKLIATAMMMVGSAAHKAEIVWYSPKGYEGSQKKVVHILESLLGTDSLSVVGASDDINDLLSTVLKVPSRRNSNSNNASRVNTCEKSWLVSAQRFWENSIRKSTLYSDYIRFMP
ncbi:SMG9-like protein [Dinothrombium tinctorium]|uniref:SMG9-like protein n=1 Tax=Dinothrombium tinctorium TaxID=1965070 RepID=A0A443QUY9_9ACAR|nr:SMG9-like protein [Dinothrombium tinctorium]